MIISRTPFRVSLFGGGTDYPAWYEQHGGLVVGGAINHYCWITVRRLPRIFDYRHRLVYSEIELTRELKDIRHPAIRECLRYIPSGEISVHHEGDLPARTGLGSSSSFTVGLLNALHTLRGHAASPAKLADEAVKIERDVLGENVGVQDQAWAAYGGLNAIEISRAGVISARPLRMDAARRADLNDSLMLFYTGMSRFASEIAGKQIANFAARKPELSSIKLTAAQALEILESGQPLDTIGTLLHHTWMAKRRLAEGVSDDFLDGIYERAREAGALGGKLLGAGGGGFFLFYVPRAKQNDVREALVGFRDIPFALGAEGSKIVVYEPGAFSDACIASHDGPGRHRAALSLA